MVHPAGAVKVRPAGVARGLSVESFSGAGSAGAAAEAERLGAGTRLDAEVGGAGSEGLGSEPPQEIRGFQSNSCS
jgi:hypothetical protein